MNCKEFEKKIPFFLNETMDYNTMEDFQQHMYECNACKEELSIQFLVQEGMKHLENGDAFDLDAEFEARIEKSRKANSRHWVWVGIHQWVCTFLLVVAGVAALYFWG